MQEKEDFTIKTSRGVLFVPWFFIVLFGLAEFGMVTELLTDPAKTIGVPLSQQLLGPMLVAVMLVGLLLFLNSAHRTLQLRGSLLTIRRRIIFPITATIDLAKVFKVDSASIPLPAGTPSTLMHTRKYRYLILESNDGQRFQLDIGYYKHGDLALKTIFTILKSNGAVLTDVTDVNNTLNDWNYELPVSSNGRGGIADIPIAKPVNRKKKLVVGVLAGALILGIIGLLIYITITREQQCQAIQDHGVDANAQVDTLIVDRLVGRGVYASVGVDQASRIQFTAHFTDTSGVDRSERITAEYTYNADLQMLYKQVLTGQIEIRYLPSDPASIRPTSEFTTNVAKQLCSQ